MAWICPNCGACWSDLFLGPCPHPRVTVTATDTLPPQPPPCDHDFIAQDTTMGGMTCRKCGRWEPTPQRYYSVSAVGGQPEKERT